MKISPIKIFLIEDNPADARLIREMLADADEKDSFAVTHVTRLGDALGHPLKQTFDAVLLDLMLPDSAGIETFLKLYKEMPDQPAVVLTGLTDETLAVKAVREGAQDYLVKGHVDTDILVRAVRYAIERKAAEVAAKKPLSEAAEHSDEYQYLKMIGTGSSLKQAAELINTVAKTSGTSVLIQGETGTGKGLAASAIHYLSSRKNKPFIKINCSSIPDTLLETELFGYEKGAFTDAKQSKKGLFEVAEGGTIFLDEIGDMDIRLQPKLLHVLENRTFHRVGGTFDVKVDVRIIAAANKDLSFMVKEKRFREDLYYRLNVMTINIPALRERKEDILSIAEYFIRENNRIHRKDIKRLSAETGEIFLKYPWPGNVREMKNVIERAVLIADTDEILPRHLPPELSKHIDSKKTFSVYPSSEDMSLEEMEKAHIQNVLNKVKGNKTQASRILGISRLTLREKIKKYGISKAIE